MRKVELTPIQGKFFKLLLNAALEDDEMAKFITASATGKTFVIEQIKNTLLSLEQARSTLELPDIEFKGVKNEIKSMVEKGEFI